MRKTYKSTWTCFGLHSFLEHKWGAVHGTKRGAPHVDSSKRTRVKGQICCHYITGMVWSGWADCPGHGETTWLHDPVEPHGSLSPAWCVAEGMRLFVMSLSHLCCYHITITLLLLSPLGHHETTGGRSHPHALRRGLSPRYKVWKYPDWSRRGVG